MHPDQTADITWRDGTIPVSTRFDDPYFSFHNGLEETRHVFLNGNRLAERFEPGFHIAELGFGTGLNLLAACACWRDSGQAGPLRFTSFEAYPMSHDDLATSLAHFPELSDLAVPLVQAWATGQQAFETDWVHAEIIVGDVRETLPAWSGSADAWFLDGFAPAKNPQMWEPALMNEVARHTRPDGTFATYTAAGEVRRALQEAGFEVERIAGYGRKRHMTTGKFRGEN